MSALRRNVASQVITFGLVTTAGAAGTGATVTTKVTKDGTQAAGAGTVTELGSGQYKYVPTQSETNATSVGFHFSATGIVPVNIHCFTSPAFARSVAFSDFLFYMTDSTNHAGLAGLVDANFTAKQYSLDGAAFTGLSGTITDVGGGWYKISLTASELAGNNVGLRFAASGADTTNVSLVMTA